VDGAAFNSRLWEHEPLCLPETRVDLLQQIMTWSEDPNGACIFWLNGIAGTGKSTISRTVARACADQKRLGACFFFSRGRGDLGHATKFFASLAVQLANTVPALKPYVCRALAENLSISQHGLAEQWEHLIFQPLSNLKGVRSQSFILVIDALDECEGEDDTRLILRLLAEVNTLNTVRLQVFMTSRPETPIRFGFHAIPDTAHQDFVLHNISPSIIQHDISIFLHHKLENIRRENGFSEGWPGESRNGLLCQRASGLFIYASTACRFIRDPLWDPDESLSLILQDDYVGQSPTRELDEMYTKILTHSIILGDRHKRDSEKLSGEFRQLIGAIVILFDALPASMLARLLEMPIGTVGVRLRCLHSVMDVPDNPKSPIRLLHPSFRNFLLDHQRCLDPQFWIDEKMAHMDLLMNCLKLMSKHLQRDMCNLRLPGAVASNVENSVVEKCIPLDVQYACRYWVYHLQRGSIELDNKELENKELDNKELRDNGQVHIFLKHHFLHWLEALSLIGRISEGVLAVKCLESMTVSDYIAKHYILVVRLISQSPSLKQSMIYPNSFMMRNASSSTIDG